MSPSKNTTNKRTYKSRKQLTKSQQLIRTTILNSIVNDAIKKKQECSRLPHQYCKIIISSYQLPWLNANLIKNKVYREQLKQCAQKQSTTPSILAVTGDTSFPTSSATSVNGGESNGQLPSLPPSSRKNGGRPKGSTIAAQSQIAEAIHCAKNEIVEIVANEKKKKKGNLEKKIIAKIISQVAKDRNLPIEHNINKRMIQKRLERKNYFIPFNSPKGPTSPLTGIEDDVVALILAMSKCRQSLNVSQGLQLINDIIFKTQHQKKLITFKERHCSSSKGCVGKGYWRGFLRGAIILSWIDHRGLHTQTFVICMIP